MGGRKEPDGELHRGLRSLLQQVEDWLVTIQITRLGNMLYLRAPLYFGRRKLFLHGVRHGYRHSGCFIPTRGRYTDGCRYDAGSGLLHVGRGAVYPGADTLASATDTRGSGDHRDSGCLGGVRLAGMGGLVPPTTLWPCGNCHMNYPGANNAQPNWESRGTGCSL